VGNDKRTFWDLSRTFRAGATALALLALVCNSLTAQGKLLPVLHFKTLEGYHWGDVVSRIVRDSTGFVWIGSVNGLLRYDGYTYKVYRNISGDSNSLPSNRIHSLLVDSKGRLWVGTLEKGLCLYDPTRDRFIHVYPGPNDLFPNEPPTVFSMTEDHSGNIWLAMTSPGDVVRLEIPADRSSDDLDSLARGFRIRRFPLGTPKYGARDLCERKDGKIIIACHYGLRILDPATGLVSPPYLEDPKGRRLDTLYVYTLAHGSDGKLWLGTPTEGLFGVDWSTGKVVNYRHHKGDSLSIGIDDIWDLAMDRDGHLWVGTMQDVELFSPETGQRVPFMTFEQSPPGNYRIRLSIDCTGTLWVSGGNVYRLSPRSQLFPHFTYWDRNAASKTIQPWLGSFQNIERTPEGNLWSMSGQKLVQIDVKNCNIIKTFDLFAGKKPLVGTAGPTTSLRPTGLLPSPLRRYSAGRAEWPPPSSCRSGRFPDKSSSGCAPATC